MNLNTPVSSMDAQDKGAVNLVHSARVGVTSPTVPEKIRLTKAGLIFSGHTAYLSNHARAEFEIEGTPYTSSEQWPSVS